MPAVLGAPYGLSRGGLWNYAAKMDQDDKPTDATVIYGELARPEND